MNRFLYIIKNAFHNLVVKSGFNFIVVMALSIGLFLPMLFLAKSNYRFNFFSHSLYTDAEMIAVVDGITKYMPTEKIDKTISSIKGVTDFAYTANIDASIEREESAFLSGVAGISENYFNLRNATILEGRLPTPDEIKNNERICVARQTSDFTDDWIMKPGDKFTINGEEFTLVGIIIEPTSYGTFMIPYGFLEKMVRPNLELQYVLSMKTTPDNVEYVLDYTKALGFVKNILQSMSAANHEAEIRHQNWIVMKKSFVRDLILLGFSLVVFTIIMYGKFVESLYTWGVKIALGETKGAIFLELFLQNLILILLAAIAPAIVICYIIPNIIIITMLTDWVWFAAVAALCVLIALIVTIVLYLALMRKKIPDMLKVK